MLDINMETNETEQTAYLKGRLDINSAPDLEKALRNISDTVMKLILDFKDLRYLSSAGLRVILSVQKTLDSRDGELVIRNVNSLIMEIFDATGLTDILKIENEEEP